MRQDTGRPASHHVRVTPGVNHTDVGVIIVTLERWARLRARGPEYHQSGGTTVKIEAGALIKVTV